MYCFVKITEAEYTKIINNLKSVLDFANKICSNCCDVQKLETRIDILKKRAEIEKINVPKDVIRFIASKITSNNINLNSALLRVSSFMKFTNTSFTVEKTKKFFKDLKIEKYSGCSSCPYNKIKNDILDILKITKTTQKNNKTLEKK